MKTKPCPFCLGKGKVVVLWKQKTYDPVVALKAVNMRREGKTLRAIAKELKYKSPQSIQHLIKQWFQRQI